MQVLDYELIKEKEDNTGRYWWFKLGEGKNLHGDTVLALRVEIYYSLGGMNYFSGSTKPRGYYVNIKPVELGGGFESSTLLGNNSGGYQFLEATNRLNRKRLLSDGLEALAVAAIQPFIETLVTNFLAAKRETAKV